jgi:hypothetical protein
MRWRLWTVLLPRSLTLAFALMVTMFVACAPSAPQSSGRHSKMPAPADSMATLPFLLELSPPASAASDMPGSPLLALTDTPIPLRSKCNEQRAQSFLMRNTYIYRVGLTPDEVQHRKILHRNAIEYRTRHYGTVEGFGDLTLNPRPPYDYTSEARFFGINIRMNTRVLFALGCVEETIKQTCSNAPYVPLKLDGLRAHNTFHNNEVSNHLYGIAIDVDPERNACCHCVAPSKDAPICKKPATTPFDHAEIPPCWVDAFERYGFYWLGHDVLEDTMHFEFLGNPNQIKASHDPPRAP